MFQIGSSVFHFFHIVIHETGIIEAMIMRRFSNCVLFQERHYYECSGKGQDEEVNYKLPFRLIFFNLLHFTGNKIFNNFVWVNLTLSPFQHVPFATVSG